MAVLTDEAGAARVEGAPVLVADAPRSVLGEVSSWVHGHPSEALSVLGVTGTNGKTTTAFMLEAGLRAGGHRTGLVGTVVTRLGDEAVPSTRTTPEATDLHALFAAMLEQQVTAVAMEVSSHALAYGRVDGVRFDVAAFTNLSQDHLDFHTDMEDYFRTKATLFTPGRCAQGVVNSDDSYGRRLLADPQVPMVSFGADADWPVRDVELRPDGSTFRIGAEAASVQLPGEFNVSNAAAAVVTLVQAGVPIAVAVSGVAGLPGVPGRMERVDVGQPFTALVDYAHTPEAVETLLRSVRAVTPGRVIVVLGCGGDRDRSKRPLMGRAAVEGADVAVLTSDNPRSEDPLAILAEMGRPDAPHEVDRRKAIALAVSMARAGDTVVVAGKGHETGQDVGGVVTHFDDREVLREVLSS